MHKEQGAGNIAIGKRVEEAVAACSVVAAAELEVKVAKVTSSVVPQIVAEYLAAAELEEKVTMIAESVVPQMVTEFRENAGGGPARKDIESIVAEKVQVLLPSVAGFIAERMKQMQVEADMSASEKNADEQAPANVECAAEKEAVDPLVKQHVQLQCLRKVTLNGNIAFVMDSKPEGRYAVYVPAAKQRLSIHGDKLRPLTAAEAADYFDNPRYWKQGYHAKVKHELNTYEAEKHASQGIPLNEGETTGMGINEARKQKTYEWCRSQK